MLLGAMTAFGAMSTDLYLPALPSMAQALGASPAMTQQTIASFLLGMAAGQLIWGALSDRFGRLRPLYAGYALYLAASIACALAPDVAALIAARFVQGLGGCASIVIARAVVRDEHDERDTARIFTWLTLVFGIAPVVAPFLGSALLAFAGWRAIFWTLAAFGAVVAIAAAVRLPETRGPGARALARSEPVLSTYRRLLRDRRIAGLTIAVGFGAAGLFAYVSTAPTLFITDFGLSPTQFSALFAVNALAMVAASQLNRRALRRLLPDVVAARAMAVSVVIGGGFAAAALAGWGGLAVTAVASFLLIGAFGFMAGNLGATAMSVDPLSAGSIAALIGVANFGIGAGVAAAAAAAHDGTPLPLALTVTVSYALALGALYWLAPPGRR